MTYEVSFFVEASVADGPEPPDEVTSAIAGFFRESLGWSAINRQYEDGRSTICNGRVVLSEVSMVSARPLIQ
jgi:hypothetical protein